MAAAQKKKRGAGAPPVESGPAPARGPARAPTPGPAAEGKGGAANAATVQAPAKPAHSTAPAGPTAPPPGRTRIILRNATIVGFLGWQLLFPLRYYLGDDPFDERFAWRMFSPVRLVSCDARLFDADRRPINLAQGVHVVWVNLLKRARLQVLDAVADRLCADAEAEGRPAHLYAEITCPPPDGPTLGICRQGLRDADRDGVPDGFNDATQCDGKSPKACFVAACGERDAATCHRETCVLRVVDPADDLCDERDG